jgi:hypothetical protein
MEFNFLKIVKEALRGNLQEKDISEEEVERLADEGAQQVVESFNDQSFEDLAASLREKYPDATEEQLERAITITEDGWSLSLHELPPKPLQKELQDWKKRGSTQAVEIMAYRVEGLCDVCREDNFECYTVEMAIERQILPHDNCTCTGPAASDGASPCGCTYAPAFLKQVPESRR